jgi:outer membrane protein OmpA-like peptidoglycan-associated protein
MTDHEPNLDKRSLDDQRREFGEPSFADHDDTQFSPDSVQAEPAVVASEMVDAAEAVDAVKAEQPADNLITDSAPAAVRASQLTNQSSYARTRSARRRWRRRLAALLTAVFFLGWLLYGATFKRATFEAELEQRAKIALSSNEFSAVRVTADGRNLVLKGSVASADDAKLATDLVKRVRYVQNVDTSKLVIGGSDGNVLPLKAVYAEGKLSFEGSRPSDESVDALVQAASKGLGDGNVTIQFAEVTGTGGSPDAYGALGASFGRFVDLQVRSAVVDITPEETVITGRLGKADGQAEIIQSLTDATSRVVRDNLEIEEPAVGAPGATSSVVDPVTVDPVVPVQTTTLSADARATLQAEVSATLKSNRIDFATDSSALSAAAKAIIADLATQLKPSGVPFEVGGHTDSRGRKDKNQQLSQRRADAVREEFVKNGITPALVTAVGFGSDKVIAVDGARGNPLNRRIEITLK